MGSERKLGKSGLGLRRGTYDCMIVLIVMKEMWGHRRVGERGVGVEGLCRSVGGLRFWDAQSDRHL